MKRSALPLVRGVANVTDTVLLADVAQGAGLIAGAVIGEETADGDAELGVVAESGEQEGGSGKAFFIGQDLGKGDAGVVVDGDMDVLPADVAGIAFAVAMDAVADAADAAQFLDVEMEQIAGGLMLVANDRRGRLEIADTVELEAFENAADGGWAEASRLGDTASGPA